jgi:hypothetical protein
MNPVIFRAVLRLAAIAIGVVAIADPAMPIGAVPRASIVVVDVSSGGAGDIAAELSRLRNADHVIERAGTPNAIPCGVDERCVVVADGAISPRLPDDLRTPMALIALDPPAAPNLRVESVTVAAAQHAAAAGTSSIVLAATAMTGRESEVRITDGDALVGAAVHKWKADGRVTIEVPWWPMATGLRAIRARVAPFAGETAAFDNAVDIGVEIAAARIPVLVFDARPSWQSTYVRRVLEDDPRFAVEHRARVAPSISAGTADGRLDAPALAGARAVIAGGLDALTTADVDRLERFARDGGGLILLPDRRPTGAVSRLVLGEWRERLSAEANPVGPLRAAEILTAEAAPATSTVLGRSAGAPAIVATPLGQGVIIVAGAMDAWRHRDADGGAFDRFWRSVTAEAAISRVAVRVAFEDRIARAHSRLGFTVRAAASTVSAVGRCDGGPAQPVRLWPSGTPGVFHGELAIGARGPCRLDVAAGDQRAHAGVAVVDDYARPATGVLAALDREVRRRGGVVATRADLRPIAAALEASASSSGDHANAHPMRSALWIVPFAGLLSIEWWLRRRSGLS